MSSFRLMGNLFPCLVEASIAQGYQRILQRFPGHRFDVAFHQPAHSSRDAAAETDRLALDGHAPVALLKAPITIEPPQESAVIAHRLLFFRARAGIRYFGNFRGEAVARYT